MEFGNILNKYGIKKPYNSLLTEAILQLRMDRPKVKNEQKYTIYTFPNTSTLQFWIRTTGCTYSQKGSCSMCDYWIGNTLDAPHLVIRDALAPYIGLYNTLILETSGSLFDENELPISEQELIWQTINTMGFSVVIIETHARSITYEKLSCLKQSINAFIVIEMGLESSNPDVLFYCLNKPVSLDLIQKKIKLIHSQSISCCVNILLGAPFLSVRDRITDCISSIRDVLKAGADTCVIFPVNIKEYTLVNYLHQNNLYQQVLGRELVEVLSAFSENELERINIAWVKPHKQMNSAYTSPIVAPYFCKECEQPFFDLLDQYLSTYDGSLRHSLVLQMKLVTKCCEKKLQTRLLYDKSSEELMELGYDFLFKGTELNEK